MDGYIRELRKAVGKRPLIQCGASVIIASKDRILLQRRTDNEKWGLPGGSMEIGETLEETAAREVFEETGLMVLPGNLSLFRVFSGERQHYIYPNGDEVYNVVAVFTTSIYTGEPRTDGEENSKLQFFDYKDLPLELNPPEIEIIEAYFIKLLKIYESFRS
jgi:ADP-ribose pyrophosphatase